MNKFDDLSLSQIVENEVRIADMRAKMQARVGAISSLVSENKFAMVALCQDTEFLSMARKAGVVSSVMTNEVALEYICERLTAAGKNEEKGGDTGFNWSAVKQSAPAPRGRKKSQSQSQARNAVYLEVVNGCLTGRGYGDKDKDWRTYKWLKPSEFMRIWLEDANNSQHKWLGIYAIRIDGKDYLCAANSRWRLLDAPVSDIGGNSIGARFYSGVSVLRRLMLYMYEQYGEEAVVEFCKLYAAGDLGDFSPFIAFGSQLRASGVKTDNRYKYINLTPSSATSETVFVEYDGISALKDKLGSKEVYWRFNNPCFLTEVVTKLLLSFVDCVDDDYIYALDDKVEYLILE